MKVAVDIGNTNTKIGFFEGDTLVRKLDKVALEEIASLVNASEPSSVIVSSVTISAEGILDQVKSESKLILNANTLFPFQSAYQTPLTLGTDRIAIVAGGQSLFPSKNCLVIGLGTCITYDLLTSEGKYWGGAISPGVYMRFKAMNTFTARLPLVQLSEEIPEPTGHSTNASIQAGVYYGVLHEMEGFIAHYQAQHQDLQIIICGGDVNLFEKKIKASIFAVPDLVLIGLNAILTYNVDTKEK